MTLLGTLIKHQKHILVSSTEYVVPPGAVYGTPHVRLYCRTCDETCASPIWEEVLGESASRGDSASRRGPA